MKKRQAAKMKSIYRKPYTILFSKEGEGSCVCGWLCVPHVCLSCLSQVLITIYWLGRKAHIDAFYSGPQLNFKAFEGLLGLALSKVSCSSKLLTQYSLLYFLSTLILPSGSRL